MSYDPNERIYTIKDASKHFGVKAYDIYQAIKTGTLNASQVPDGLGRHGWKYMIYENDLKKWMNGDEKEEPIHINTSFTPISELLKEGQSMTAEEMQKKLDNAVVENDTEFDVKEVAEYLGYSISRIKTLIKYGVLDAEKVYDKHVGGPYGFRYMVRKSVCDDFIAKHGKHTPEKKRPYAPRKKKEAVKPDIVETPVVESESSKFEDLIASLRISYNLAYKAGYEDGYDQARKEFEEKLKEVFKV